MPSYRGRFHAKGRSFAIVVSRFNEFVTKRLLESACETLEQAGVSSQKIKIVWVPGALEVPFFCKKLLASKKFSAVIALGCILRGDTYHYECVAHEVTRGISQAALETGFPVASGIITANRLEEAMDRAGLKAGNKGQQAALAALEISDLNQRLKHA